MRFDYMKNRTKYRMASVMLICAFCLGACGSSSNVSETPAAATIPNESIVVAESVTDEQMPAVTNATDGTEQTGETETADGIPIADATLVIEEEESEEPEPENPTVSIIMVGDVLFHTPVAKSGVQEDGSYQFDQLFENVSDVVEAADLALVNQEVIIGGEELGVSGYPCFNAPYELGDALVDAGFDVALHATNHALDKGEKGLTNCMEFWENNYPDMEVLGIHDSAEDQEEIYVYEQDGMKIAILNYTYGTNGVKLPKDMPYVVDMLDEDKIVSDLAKAQELADFIIVCPHWGTEYNLGMDSWQGKWTQLFLENGVDLVMGAHPHVIEPIEWVTDDAGNEMLVYYSLGNFVSWTSSSGSGVTNRMVGGMAQVELQRDEDGEVVIAEYGVEPLVTHLEEGTNGVTTYFLKDYTQELASRNAIIAQDQEFSLKRCQEICMQVWGE